MNSRKLITIAVSALILLTGNGCNSPSKRPMTTSLSDMQFEGRFTNGKYLDEQEILSIAGDFPIAEAGALYIYDKRALAWYNPLDWFKTDKSKPPVTVVGLSTARSYRLVGTSDAIPTHSQLVAVRNALIATQQDIVAYVSNASSRILIEQKLKRTTDETDQASLRQAQAAMEPAYKEALGKAKNSLDAFRASVKQPGIVVANWTQEKNTSGWVGLGKILSLDFSKEDRKSGLVILGGLRVSMLFVGSNFKDFYMNLGPGEQQLFDKVGIVTYLLQANDVLAVNALDVKEQIAGALKLKKEYFTNYASILADLDEINLRYQSSFVQNLNNVSATGTMNWKKEAVTFDGGKAEDDYLKAEPESSYQWRTLHSVMTMASRVYGAWAETLEDALEEKFPRLGTYVGKFPQSPEIESHCRTVDKELSQLRAATAYDLAYVNHTQIHDALKVLSADIKILNRHLDAKVVNEAAVTEIVLELRQALQAVNAKLGATGWTGIRRLSPEGLDILKAVYEADARIQQFTTIPLPPKAPVKPEKK